jgi:uncharacterized membrane protein
MTRVIFVGFDTEQKAYEGDRALRDMHREGTLTLYNDAVVVKEPDGAVALRRPPDADPIGTVGGMITGGLIGLLGGPVGAAVGMSAGTLLGAAFDLTNAGLDQEFVEDIGERLAPGNAAVIAEIEEQWQVPLDTRMETLGGKVLRRTRPQIEDAYLERTVDAAQKELADLEAEKLARVKTAQTEKARKEAEKLQAKIDGARRKVALKEKELSAKMQALKEEGSQKIALLEAQKATAVVESKALLDQRLAAIRDEYGNRTSRLQDSLERRKAAHAASAA